MRLVTATPGVALAILVADCVPVVLWDPVRRAVGVAHAGRNGTILGVVPATIAAMAERFGTEAAHLRAGIGPHIAGPSYEVGPRRGRPSHRGVPAPRPVRADPATATPASRSSRRSATS